MTTGPNIGEIWVWDGYFDCPYLVLELAENEWQGEYLCMCLADGNIRSMFFAKVMDRWTRVA